MMYIYNFFFLILIIVFIGFRSDEKNYNLMLKIGEFEFYFINFVEMEKLIIISNCKNC